MLSNINFATSVRWLITSHSISHATKRQKLQKRRKKILIKFLLIIRATKVIGASTRDVGSGTRKTSGFGANFGAEAELSRTSNTKNPKNFSNLPRFSREFENGIFYFLHFFSSISLMKKSDEEQWSLKQKLLAFEVERKSFEKEKDFMRNQIAIEQQKVQVI